MSLARALVPLAFVVTVVCGVVWLMLINDIVLGSWLLALLVFAHGWVHLMFVFPKPGSPDATMGGSEYPFDFGRSWLVRRAKLELPVVRSIGVALMAMTVLLGLLAALATVAIIVPAGWWGGLMILAAASSTVMLALFWSQALVLGFAINAAMVLLVLSGSWSPV
jgi:hypothetical protein